MNGLGEGIGVNRLDQVRVEAYFLRELLILQLSVTGDRDEDHPPPGVRGAQSTRQLPAIEARKADVDHGDIRLEVEGLCETCNAVFCLVHFVPIQLEHEAKHLTCIGAVFDNQDTASGSGGASCRPRRERLHRNGDPR